MQIYSAFSFQFWFYFILFIISCYFTFYLPGKVIISKIKTPSPLTDFALSNICGIVLWGIQGYILGYLNIRWMSYVYIILFTLIAYQSDIFVSKIRKSEIKKIFLGNKLLAGLIILGMIIQSIPVFGSGLLYPDGVRFIGVNAYDGIMHLSYIQSIMNHFPPIEPGAYDNPITNYHYWTDLVLAELVRIWRLPITHVFFQYFPLYIALLTGLIAIALVRVWGGTKSMAAWFLFLLYFAGDGAYLFMLYLHQQFGFHTPAIDNGATQFLNMPHAVAKPIFLSGLILFHFFLKKKNWITGILMAVFFAVLFGFKVYFGIYVAIGLLLYVGIVALISLIKNVRQKGLISGSIRTIKDQTILIISMLIFAVIALAIFLPPNSGSGGLVYAYLEWPRIFLNQDNINFTEWWLRRQVYEANGNIRNLIIFDSLAIFITLVSVYGTRLLGFFPSKGLLQFLGFSKALLLLPGLFIFQILSLFTLQESGGFNVFNFFSVSAVVLSLTAAFFLSQITASRSLLAKILLIIFVILTLPRPINEVLYYFDEKRLKDSTNIVQNEELEAFATLREHKETPGLIQSHPANPLDSRSQYVSFFSDRFTYLTGVGIQETHTQPIKDRKEFLQVMFKHESEDDFVSKMREKNIQFIYQFKNSEQKLRFKISDRFFTPIYDGKNVRILERNE